MTPEKGLSAVLQRITRILEQGNPQKSLQTKVTLLILGPSLLILAVAAAVGYAQLRHRVLKNMSLLTSQTAQVIQVALRRDMLASDFESMQETLDIIARDKHIDNLYLLDTDGRVVFAPHEAGVGEVLSNQEPACQPCHSLPPAQRPLGVAVTNSAGQPVFRSMQPIEVQPECSRCHDPNQRIIGLLLTDVAISPFESAIAQETRNSLLWWVGTIILIVILVNLAISRFVLRRISHLSAAIDRFGQNMEPPSLPESPLDEIGKLGGAFKSMTSRIIQRERENRDLTEALGRRMEERDRLLKRLIEAQEQERKRLARELHDDLGQGLSTVALNVELVQNTMQTDPEATRRHLGRIHDLVADATERMYDLILGLRPSSLDDLGLVAALRALIGRTLEPAGIACNFNVRQGDRRLPQEIEITLFRIIQEALTNIVKHAHAGHVALELYRQDGLAITEINDDGVGFNPQELDQPGAAERGLGLLGMRERVEQCQGTISIWSQPGEGTHVIVRLPVRET
jgi:signal transduction histidine kinase